MVHSLFRAHMQQLSTPTTVHSRGQELSHGDVEMPGCCCGLVRPSSWIYTTSLQLLVPFLLQSQRNRKSVRPYPCVCGAFGSSPGYQLVQAFALRCAQLVRWLAWLELAYSTDCKRVIQGFAGAQFKGFQTLDGGQCGLVALTLCSLG